MSPSKKSKRGEHKRPPAGYTSKPSTTVLTQDPNVAGGTIVPSDSPFIMSTPGRVIIAGPVSMPGQSFDLHAGEIGSQNDTKGQAAAINVSGAPGAPLPDLPPAQIGSSGKDSNLEADSGAGGAGSDSGGQGAQGNPGADGGRITIFTNNVAKGANLSLSADGGNGGKGQKGQAGGQGGPGGPGIFLEHNGPPYPDPISRMTGGAGGRGGRGGQGGPGGKGGNGGIINLTCPT